MLEVLWPYLMAAGLPSAACGLLVWWSQYKIQRRDKKRDEAEAKRERDRADKEKSREELDLNIVRSLSALFALTEATAKAVQRIPEAHCNGDMTRALEYSKEVKHDQREYLERQGIHALHED